METFGGRLKRILQMREMSNGELARRVGKSAAYISLIVNGKRLVDKLPNYDDMRAMAKALDVPIGVLAGDDELSSIPARPHRLTDRELFERFGIRPYDAPISVDGVYASAGPGAGLPQDVDDSIPREFARSKYLRGVDVRGDCMVPDLYPGEVVVYNVRLGAEIGKIMVALRDEEELLVKRLVLVGDDQFLHPNEGMNIRVDERIRFLGRAVAVTRRLL